MQAALTKGKGRGLNVTAVLEAPASGQLFIDQITPEVSVPALAALPVAERQDDNPPVMLQAVASLDIARHMLMTSTAHDTALELSKQLMALGLVLNPPSADMDSNPELAADYYGAAVTMVAQARPLQCEVPLADAKPFEVSLAPERWRLLPPFVYALADGAFTSTRPLAGRIVITLDGFNPAAPYAATGERYWAKLGTVMAEAVEAFQESIPNRFYSRRARTRRCSPVRPRPR